MRIFCSRHRWLAALVVGALLQLPALAAATTPAPGNAPAAPMARFIVKLRAPAASFAQDSAARLGALAARTGLTFKEARPLLGNLHVVALAAPADTLARLAADPEVEYAEPDQLRHVLSTPDDPLFEQQWYLQNSEPAAIDALDAWTLTTGNPGLVIADLDTGVRFDHPDLRNASANRLLPGYDMIGPDPGGDTFYVANNGHGRGPDASDPGDWISSSDLQNPLFSHCTVANSSWHGTRVSGILGAITNNATGIAGTTWSGWILPVRVLGKCGGYDSDILAGMAWAAGLAVNGVPDNPYPAQIINMSLGAVGACPQSYQEVVDQLLELGVLVVVSAGNEGGPVDSPANCSGVAGVVGLRHVGTKVGFSSLGPQIALGAPAGNCVNTGVGQPCLFSIETTTNSGATVPATNTYTTELNYNIGTSFSAPMVSAIAGLMLAVNGNLTSGQLIERLQAATTPYPVSTDPSVPLCHVPADASDLQTAECSCTTSACGTGMANAHASVLQALRPVAAVVTPASVTPAHSLTLDASGSAAACGGSIVSYQWSVQSSTTTLPALQNANTAQVSVVAPVAPNSYVLLLTVTDDAARTDSTQVVVNPSSAEATAPQRAGSNACLTPVSYSVPPVASTSSGGGASSGGGGGGSADLLSLAALALMGLWVAGRRYSSFCAASSQVRCARR
jgi:serine protease